MTPKKLFVTLILMGGIAILITAMRAQSKFGTLDTDLRDEQSSRLTLSQSSTGLEGSWIVDVSLNGAPQPFKSLITFTRGGGLVETDAAAFSPPIASASPAHGTWMRDREREFAFTFLKLLFDAQGNFIGTMKLHSAVKLERGSNQYTDKFKIEISDPNGSILFSSDGTGRGMRINAEPEE